ncbi:putative G-protein coupled receptor Mth-like 3 [Anticarsia gemmatalis]|uniref:putative G-protein coupled receptor Mth-like 3 n=1 Tax=Anticarsia gemmatalis TaxID=129554 RepID=UPI003F76A84F
MLSHIVFTTIFIFKVQGYELEGSTWRDMDGKIIDKSVYCEKNNCFVKCCPQGQVQKRFISNKPPVCYTPEREVKEKINYSDINVYQLNKTTGEARNTTETLSSRFVFIQNDLLSDSTKILMFLACRKFKVLQDGSLKVEQMGAYPCFDTARLSFCADFVALNSTYVRFAYTRLSEEDPEDSKKKAFIATGTLLSAFCMFLVLLVYSLISKLQNIVGKILMAYLITFMIAYILQGAMMIMLDKELIDSRMCKIMSPANYFFIMSTLFWLNVMSYDLWCNIRSMNKRYDSHCRSEWAKFSLYCLYGWGTPLLLTLVIVAVEKLELYTDLYNRPPFSSCFADIKPNQIYHDIPIGILAGINLILYVMIAYNIWLVKHAVTKTSDARNTKSNENRFLIYIKLFVLTGVGWLLELVPAQTFVLYVFINFYNAFVGVTIFVIFVCKKSILASLCERFNIKNNFGKTSQSIDLSGSETLKESSRSNRIHRNGTVNEEFVEQIPINTISTEAV